MKKLAALSCLFVLGASLGNAEETAPPRSKGVGMDDQSVSGQGFHAFRIQAHFQNPGTMFQAIPGHNLLVRATGNILVPVELMKFGVE
jgi:hypothetical protein